MLQSFLCRSSFLRRSVSAKPNSPSLLFLKFLSNEVKSRNVKFKYLFKDSGHKYIVDYCFNRNDKGWILSENAPSNIQSVLMDISGIKRPVFVIENVEFTTKKEILPVISDDSGTTFNLLTDGTLIKEITEKSVHEELEILIKKQDYYFFQASSLIKEVPSDYDEYIRIRIFTGSSIEIHNFRFDHWKNCLKTLAKNSNIWYHESGTTRHHLLKKFDLNNNDSFEVEASSEKGETNVIRTKEYMEFSFRNPKNIIVPEETIESPACKASLRTSFQHDLSKVGYNTLIRLENDLLQQFALFSPENNEYFYPLVSLCQGSGSGKSKLVLELLKRHPGFYIVFRPGTTGYPKKNKLSGEIYDILANPKLDELINLMEKDYLEYNVGRILNFFTKCIVSYWKTVSEELKLNQSIDVVVQKMGSKFVLNDKLVLNEVEPDELEILYRKVLGLNSEAAIRIEDISRFLMKILKSPSFLFPSLSEISTNYPFVFVIDEAEILSKLQISNSTAFRVLRRAISYVESGSNIIFLTLGTSSNVIDLNPDIDDDSSRITRKRRLMDPIVMTSNMNILSKEFPIHEIKPSQSLIGDKNYFKFLCTLGHPLWCSFPFNSVVNTAIIKLKNGASVSNFLPVIWMILCGLAANPLSISAGKFVASHMAYLMQISDEIKKLVVLYPSEPILAIASQKIIDKHGEELFSSLIERFEAVEINHGEVAEVIGGMIVLRSIWKSDCIPLETLNLPERIEKVTKLAPAMKTLWETKSFVLESKFDDSHPEDSKVEVDSNLDSPMMNDYRVHTVEEFLKKFLEGSKVDLKTLGLPKTILNGFITATHFISLDRYGKKSNNPGIEPNQVPSADVRIPDFSRNILSRELLELALLRFAGLKLPRGYYGLDYAIPVLLESNEVTFIGIQIKRRNADARSDIFKMRARCHFVKCSNISCTGSCSKCVQSEALKAMYRDQVSILISLDDEDSMIPFKKTKEPKVSYLKGIPDDCQRNLLEQVETGERIKEIMPKDKLQDFENPLVNVSKYISDDVMLSKSLWIDDYVEDFETESGAIQSDGFVHRQFCFSTRGWNCFASNLFGISGTYKDSIKKANKIMDLTTIPSTLNEPKSLDFARKLSYDLNIQFPFLSDELGLKMGNPSKYDKIAADECKGEK